MDFGNQGFQRLVVGKGKQQNRGVRGYNKQNLKTKNDTSYVCKLLANSKTSGIQYAELL